ncbi:hypothetical protein H0X10_01280 [Candidatus Saccharibacteria bacterium]|nr:hypothetical protein [Candidatus Saccharibacteria bacterium]
MSKKKNEEERKPDLNEVDDQAAIEARIKEMMEPEDSKPVAKPIAIAVHEDTGVPITAPELPVSKKPLAIQVVNHEDISEEPEIISESETDPELIEAIEEANKQLLGEAETTEEEKPEEPVKVVEDPAEENELDEIVEDDEAVTEEEPVELDKDVPESESAEQPEADQKEKPLKHLDSIVPKSKVEETIEDNKTDEAVEDIIVKESDALLAAEDEKLAAAFQPAPRPSFGQKIKRFFGKKAVRVIIVMLLLAGLVAGGVVPGARYFVLNTAGVRSSASLTVLDDSTQQPLRGVTVKLAGQNAQTDQDGKIAFSNLRLGQSELVIEKRAFAEESKILTIGWGSNPLDDISLKPTGSQYVFTVTDFLSGKPVAKVEAVSDEATALSNEKGEIRLTIDAEEDTEREVIISGQGYRQERFKLDLNQKEAVPLGLVSARKHAFISKRSGRFDVYKVDVDGKNEELVLPGSGSERDDMVLVPHSTDEAVALVSTKDNKRNKDGFLLSTLTVMNLAEKTSKSVTTSERVQIIDWIGSRIVYVQVKDGASGNSPDRHKLVSYDFKTQEFKDLATSNYFNDVMIAAGKVYYAPSSTYVGASVAGFFRIDADGSNKQTILAQEVWNAFRTTYEKLTLAVQQEWYELKIGETKAGKISGEPPNQTSRIYMDSPDGMRSLWVDNRDGKGVLLAYDSSSKEDKIIRTQGGLKQPIRWLSNNVIVYRVNTESETADYALNLDGGEPKKIRDVTNTSGVDTWYFY